MRCDVQLYESNKDITEIPLTHFSGIKQLDGSWKLTGMECIIFDPLKYIKLTSEVMAM